MKNDGETQASTKGTISVRLVGEALVEWRRQGGEQGEVLQAAGIDPQLLGKPYARVTSHAYSRLWLDLARRMDDEFFGMDSRRLKSGSFAFMSRCAIHEQTLEPALTGILRFLCLQFDDFQPRLQRRGGLAEIVLDEAPGRYGRALSYFTLWMITHGLACWLVGRRIPILAIDLRCPQPDYIEDYRVMFSDNLRFSRPLSRLLFNADCLALPVRRDKRELRRFLLGAPANILVRYRDPQSLAARIKAYLRSLRPGRWPDADALAGHFFMAPSTLRRKLSLEGQSYQALKDQVRRDLAISDTEMSLLMGLSFALFYTLCGIPLGRMADNRSRRGLILFGVLVWSAMTAACGLARSYWQFLTFRVGVGVGEAALSPAAYSLIADSFPRERRATAISVYSMGIYLGSGLAFLLGGLVIKFASAQGDVHLPLFGEVRPWQLIFLILGAAGVLFCLLLLAIREPARRGVGAGVAVPLGEVGAYLRANRKTVLCHNFGFACLSFAGYGSGAWVPTFFVRTHGWDAGHVGVVYGSIVAVFGCLGIVFGGRLADYWAKRGRSDANMRVGLLAAWAVIPFTLVYPLLDNANWAAALMAPTVFFLSMPFGVAPAAIQEIMPNSMRGQASAIYLFVVTLFGLGVGPTAVALVTDFVFADDMALRYSLLLVTLAAVLGAVVLLGIGLKPYRASLEHLKDWSLRREGEGGEDWKASRQPA